MKKLVHSIPSEVQEISQLKPRLPYCIGILKRDGSKLYVHNKLKADGSYTYCLKKRNLINHECEAKGSLAYLSFTELQEYLIDTEDFPWLFETEGELVRWLFPSFTSSL